MPPPHWSQTNVTIFVHCHAISTSEIVSSYLIRSFRQISHIFSDEDLWALERWHEKDTKTRDEARDVLDKACAFRHQCLEAEGWVRNRVELFDDQGNQEPDTKGAFDTTTHRAAVYYGLPIYRNRLDLLHSSVEAARISLNYYSTLR